MLKVMSKCYTMMGTTNIIPVQMKKINIFMLLCQTCINVKEV